jgi:PAS domain S-box
MEKEAAIFKKKVKELEKGVYNLRKQKLEISDANELYLKIFDDFPALIWRSRTDKLCDYFNKTWLEFTGRTMEQEFGYGWAEGVHPDDLKPCVEVYEASFDRRESFKMEYRMKNRLGEYRWIRDYGRPFYHLDNTFHGYIGSCYDITDIKNNESKLLELNATKDKFFSIIAHDLKNPFNSIIGFAECLIETVKEKDYEKASEFASIILHSSKQAMELLSNLMTWSKSQSGRLSFMPENYQLSALLNDVIVVLDGMIRQKSIRIERFIAENTYVLVDKAMICTVLRNLISNAIKFSFPFGKIEIASTEYQNEVVIAVKDYGVGISQERTEKIFVIHENQSTLGTQNESGTGLGLILCKEFVERNNGRIWVESEVGVGSTFYFSVPKSN